MTYFDPFCKNMSPLSNKITFYKFKKKTVAIKNSKYINGISVKLFRRLMQELF